MKSTGLFARSYCILTYYHPDLNKCKDLTIPFACLLFAFSRKMLERYGSLTAACKEVLRLLVKRYQQYRSNPVSLKVKPYN